MIARGLFDTLWFWPIVAWPVVFTSIFLCLTKGDAPSLYKTSGIDALFLWFYFVCAIFEVLINVYLLYVIGLKYLLALFIMVPIFSAALFPIMLRTPYAKYVYPVVYMIVAASFLTLIGIFNITPLQPINKEIHSFLTSFLR